MRLFKSTNPRRNSRSPVGNNSPGTYRSVSHFSQTKESQLLLKRIEGRRRRVRGSKVVFRKKHGLIKKIILLALLLGLLSFIFIKMDVISYFEVSFVNVEGTGSFVNTDDVKALVEKNAIDRLIFSVDEDSLQSMLTNSFLGAKSVSVSKKYPNSIRVKIEERLPLAIVKNDENANFLIDSEGYVLGLVSDEFSSLPTINYEGPVVVGTFLEKGMIPISMDILNFADQEDVKISSMSFYPNHVEVFVGGNTEVFIGYDKDSEKSLKTVSALLKRAVSENKILKKIDLRYDKVIVLYE